MALCIVAGATGIILHYRGNLEFQLEMDPSQSHWTLFKKAMHAKVPPALAPGVMAQLGLLGLLYTFRHPGLRRSRVMTVRENAGVRLVLPSSLIVASVRDRRSLRRSALVCSIRTSRPISSSRRCRT